VRGFVYAFSIVTAVVYAVIRTVAFHKPERQVSFEMMAWLLILNVVAVLIYCVRHISVAQRAYTFPVWLRYAGIIACIILLGAPHVSISTVQAAIINQRLESAARSVEPDKAAKLPDKQLETRFRKISAIANASITYKIPANPELMNKAQISIEETLRAANPRSQSVRNSGVAAFSRQQPSGWNERAYYFAGSRPNREYDAFASSVEELRMVARLTRREHHLCDALSRITACFPRFTEYHRHLQ